MQAWFNLFMQPTCMQHLCYISVNAIFSGPEPEYVVEGATEVNLPVGNCHQLHRDLGHGAIPAVS